MNSHLRRTGAIAAAALAASALTLPAGAARAATPDTGNAQTQAAATWLAGTEGADGLLPGTSGSQFAYGANLDFGIGVGLLGEPASPSLAKLKSGVDATVATDYIGDPSDPANAPYVAKAAYYYAVTGQNPADAGASHLDLVSALEADVDDTTGELGTTDSVYNQVWAVLALQQVGDPEAAKARDFLLQERGPAASDAWGYNGSTSWTNDPDATSYAVLALAPWSSDAAVKPAITAGVNYLHSVQTSSGGIDLGWGTGPNANSTGLAAVALHAAGDTQAAQGAASWIRAHQLTSGTDTGAIAYDDGARQAGVTSATLAQWASATAQALPGLSYLPTPTPSTPGTPAPATALHVKAPKKAHARHTVKVRVTGAKRGDKVIVKIRGKKVGHGKAGAGGVFKVKVKLVGKLAKRGKAAVKAVDTTSGATGSTTLKVVR